MGTGTQPKAIPYRHIGNTELDGAIWKGLVWIRGPCGAEHAMSFDTAGQLRDWLGDLFHVIIEQAIEDADEPPRVGFGPA